MTAQLLTRAYITVMAMQIRCCIIHELLWIDAGVSRVWNCISEAVRPVFISLVAHNPSVVSTPIATPSSKLLRSHRFKPRVRSSMLSGSAHISGSQPSSEHGPPDSHSKLPPLCMPALSESAPSSKGQSGKSTGLGLTNGAPCPAGLRYSPCSSANRPPAPRRTLLSPANI